MILKKLLIATAKAFMGLVLLLLTCNIIASCTAGTTATTTAADYTALYEGLPFDMPTVEQPTFPAYSVSITDFGAVGDGVTLNTQAINDAIADVNHRGGGTVEVPAGIWLTGPIQLLSNVCLHTAYNALVLFSNDFDLYPIIDTSFEGLNTKRCTSPIWAHGADNIAITGHGTFEGNGDAWRPVKKSKLTSGQWKTLVASGGVLDKDERVWYPTPGALKGALATTEFNTPQGDYTPEEWNEFRPWLRPVLLSFIKCNKVLLQGVTFKNSPAWCLHPLQCRHITLDGIYVSNPWYSQNGDALDMESCCNALIVNSIFDAGDDAICIKSGKDKDGRDRGEPCQNVIVRNNTVLHGHGGFVVGSEMSGGVKNIFVANNTFIGTDVGLRFKSTRGRGGVVENIHIQDINMINIPGETLLFDLFYGGQAPGETTDQQQAALKAPVPPVTEETPAFRNIFIHNVTCKGAGKAMYFNGLPEMPVENVVVDNVKISDAKVGIEVSQVVGVKMTNIDVQTTGPVLRYKDAKDFTFEGTSYEDQTSTYQVVEQ